MKIPKYITALLVLFLLALTGYSFYQYYYLPLDGDLASIVVPAPWYSEVLQDPFGLDALMDGKRYSGNNRFFAHWTLGAYFKTVPNLLQAFVDPVTSPYLAAALIRTFGQLFITWLIATYITGFRKWWRPEFILAAALITPLFQLSGHVHRMTIIGGSVTYSFFYAFSLASVILFFLPFYRAYVLKQEINFKWYHHVLLTLLLITIPFQGPLNLGIAAIITAASLFYFWWQNLSLPKDKPQFLFTRFFGAIYQIPKPVLFHFSFLLILSLYSFYIATFNPENDNSNLVSLSDRFNLLLTGLNQQLFYGEGMVFNPGYSLLFLLIIINGIILWKQGKTGKKSVKIIWWITLFSLFYICLLPLGGYRPYRPYIVDANTFLPITILIFFAYGLTSWQVLTQINFKIKKYYILTLSVISGIFIALAKPNQDAYRCEKEAILKLAASKEQFTNLDTWCGLLSWGPLTDPYYSQFPVKLLQHWNIVNEDKTYVTRKDN